MVELVNTEGCGFLLHRICLASLAWLWCFGLPSHGNTFKVSLPTQSPAWAHNSLSSWGKAPTDWLSGLMHRKPGSLVLRPNDDNVVPFIPFCLDCGRHWVVWMHTDFVRCFAVKLAFPLVMVPFLWWALPTSPPPSFPQGSLNTAIHLLLWGTKI